MIGGVDLVRSYGKVTEISWEIVKGLEMEMIGLGQVRGDGGFCEVRGEGSAGVLRYYSAIREGKMSREGISSLCEVRLR